MGTPLDLTGQRFGKLLVVSRAVSPVGYEHHRFWLCRCDCGDESIRKTGQLRYAEKLGKLQACPKCGATRHGRTGTSEHRIWIQMHDRCRRPAHPAYANYGGRGITVCERWHVFENFLADMGTRPSRKHSLDRIDNDKGYAPENCRWTTSKKQNRNRRTNALLTFNGKTQCISAWADETGFSIQVIRMRLNSLGWSIEKTLTTPLKKPTDKRARYSRAALYKFNDDEKTLSEWAAHTGFNLATLRNRLNRGWSIERLLTEPIHP